MMLWVVIYHATSYKIFPYTYMHKKGGRGKREARGYTGYELFYQWDFNTEM